MSITASEIIPYAFANMAQGDPPDGGTTSIAA
jgi:hypothetical protein